MKKISNLLMMALLTIGMGLTSCDEMLDNAVDPGVTPTVEEIIKYGFQLKSLGGVDLTGDVTSLKMTKADGTLVAEAEVSGGKITIKNTDLTAASITAAADFWFEATVGTDDKYIAKVNIDPKALSPETDKTLAMATLGDVILSDGKFAAPSSTGTKVAMIAYLGSSTGVDGYTHGLALALTDEASDMNWTTATGASGAAAHTTAAPTPMTSSWMLPSMDQWTNMINAAGGYTALSDGFSGISGASKLSGNYWSSTELLAGAPGQAWYYNFDFGSGNPESENAVLHVRACLAF